MKNNIIQNNSRPKPNYKIVYCSLKTCYYEELEPVELQNIKTSTTFLKLGKHFEKQSVKLSDLTSKFFFFRIESIFCEPFPKNNYQYFHYLPSSFSI